MLKILTGPVHASNDAPERARNQWATTSPLPDMGAGAGPCLFNGAFFAPAVYLVLRVAETAENLIGMLPELRRERSD